MTIWMSPNTRTMIRRAISELPGPVRVIWRLSVRTVSCVMGGASGCVAVETGGWPANGVRSWVTTVRSTWSSAMRSPCAFEHPGKRGSESRVGNADCECRAPRVNGHYGPS